MSGAMISVNSAPQAEVLLSGIVADAGPDQTFEIGETVQFDGTGSYDPNTPMIEDPVILTDVSGNGEFVVTGWNTSVTLFSISSDVPLWTYDAGSSVRAAALSESGQYLAIGYTNNVAFFDTDSPTPLWTYTTTYPIATAPRESLDISRDGEYVAVGTGNTFTSTGDMYMLDRAGNLLWTDSYPNDVRSVRLSGDGNYVVAGSWMHQIRLYDVQTGARLWTVSSGDPYYSTALSYDASVIAGGQGNANYLRLFNRAGTILKSYQMGGHIAQIAMSDDGAYMAEAQYVPYTLDAFRLIRTDSDTPVWTYPLSAVGRTIDMALDASYIAAGGNDGNVYLFDRFSGDPLLIHPTGGAIWEASMDYAGEHYAVSGNTGLYVFTTAGDMLWHWTNARPGPGYELSYSWDFGDGGTGIGPTPTHVYGEAGGYTVTLTVTSSSGGSATDTMIATATSPVTTESDLSISPDDISLSGEPVAGTPITITANVQGDSTVMGTEIQETLLFHDDFDDGDLDGWRLSQWNPSGVSVVTDARSHSPPYSWYAQSYSWQNTGPWIAKVLDGEYPDIRVETHFQLPTKSQSYDRFHVLRLSSVKPGWVDTGGDVHCDSNFMIQLTDDDYSLDIVETYLNAEGTWETVYHGMNLFTLDPNRWYKVACELVGNKYRFLVDGNPVAEGLRHDDRATEWIILGDTGGSGGCYGEAYWDNVAAYALDESAVIIKEGQDATCTVSFYVDSVSTANLIGSVEDVFVQADGHTPVPIDWNPVAGEHGIIVVVDNVSPPDPDMSNNVASIPVTVAEPDPAELYVDKIKLSGIDEGVTHTYYEWELLITVTNAGGSAACDVLLKDVLPAELELLEYIPSVGSVGIWDHPASESTRAGHPPPTILPIRATHITWGVGTLEPGQSETLYLKVCTRQNPAGKQEFTSPGIYIINEGAYAEGTDSLTLEPIYSDPAPAITVNISEGVGKSAESEVQASVVTGPGLVMLNSVAAKKPRGINRNC